jgi:hypothetical protein
MRSGNGEAGSQLGEVNMNKQRERALVMSTLAARLAQELEDVACIEALTDEEVAIVVMRRLKAARERLGRM